MPAALLMASLQAAVKAMADGKRAPHEITERVREILCGTLQGGRFVTFFLAELDAETLRFRYTNAGHSPPLVMRDGQQVERLVDGGPAIARLMRGQPYSTAEVRLQRGDRLIMFTDGVTEARSPEGEELGEPRVVETVLSMAVGDAIVPALLDRVQRFTAGAVYDDVTILAMTLR